MRFSHNFIIFIISKSAKTGKIIACSEGHTSVVELLIASSAIDVNQHEQQNITLNVASDEGHVEVVRLLLQQPSIDLNKKDDWNDSPLNVARKKRTPGVAFDDHTEIVQLLVSDFEQFLCVKA